VSALAAYLDDDDDDDDDDDSSVMDVFEQLDTNQDECIDEAEFEANPPMEANTPTWAMIEENWGNGSCISREDAKIISEAMQALTMLDSNSDGRLSYGEFVAAMIDNDVNPKDAFDTYDAIRGSSDEYITMEDLLKIITSQPDEDNSGDDGEEQMSDLDRFRFQWFVPKTSMCILNAGSQYHSDNGVDNQYDTSAKCTAKAGHKWMSPRWFEEGRWNTDQSCTLGVCSSAPWDWELAKKPGKCEQLGGSCSRYCKTCDTWSDKTEYCIIDGITTQETCANGTSPLKWNMEHSKCYGTSDHPDCFQRNDMRRMSCHDLGSKGCDLVDWTNDPLYNGEVWRNTFNSFGLNCYTNNYATCKDQATCVSGGSCDDWTYASWNMEMDGQSSESTSVCRIPFTTGAEWGGPDSKSCGASGGYVQSDDACIVHNMDSDECTLAGGDSVKRAETEGECLRFKGCFNQDMYFNTAVPEAQCQNPDICDADQFKWKNVLEWDGGEWYPSKMSSNGIKWTERKLVPKNKWAKVIAWNVLDNLVQEAGYALAAEAFKTEFNCHMEPLYDILEQVACACSADRASDKCLRVVGKVITSTVALQTVFLNDNEKTIKTAVGSVTITAAVIAGSVKKGKDNVQVDVQATPAWSLRIFESQRRVAGAGTSCSDFEIIKSQGQVVGQLIGYG